MKTEEFENTHKVIIPKMLLAEKNIFINYN